MARISFDEFSSGLPVTRSGGSPKTNPQEAQPTYTDGVKEDYLAMGTDLQAILDKAGTDRRATRSRVESGEISPAKGVFQTLGQGLKSGGEFIGSAAMGFGKMVLPQSVQQRVSETLGKDLAAMPSVKESDFYKELQDPQGGVLVPKEVNEQLGTQIKDFIDYYESDPNFKADVDASMGIGGAVLSFLDAAAPKPKMKGDIPVKGGDTNWQNIPIRTPEQALEETLQATAKETSVPPNPTQQAGGVGATVSGIGTQIKDFAGRTVQEAQDVAAKEQRLSTLPEPEAKIRRVVSDERVIDLIDNMTPEERAVTQRLVDQAKLKQGDITTNTAHPKTIVGEEMLKPVEHIINTRKSVGAKLGEVRTQLSDAKNINTNNAFRSFHQYLKDSYGVKFDKKGNIVPGSGTMAASDVKLVQGMYDELRRGTFMSQKQIDQWLQRTYKDYDLVPAANKTFTDDVTRIAERARQDMGQLMPSQYNALRTRYAELSKPLKDFVDLLQYKGSLDDITAKNLKSGEIGMRVLGNAADRPQSVIDAIVKSAKDYGYDSTVDINRVIAMADQLEGLYDITMPRSFAGQTSRGIDQSQAVGALSDAASMNVGGLYNRAMQSRATQAEIQQAFDDYLKSYNDKTVSKAPTGKGKVSPNMKAVEQEGDLLLKDLEARQLESSQSSVPDYLKNNKQAGFVSGSVKQINVEKEIASLERLIKKFENEGVPTSNPTLRRLIAKRNELYKLS